MCIVSRPVGIRRMAALGYNTIILRDATWGSELPETWKSLDIEINNGFSASSEELVTYLKKVWPRAIRVQVHPRPSQHTAWGCKRSLAKVSNFDAQ